MLEAELARFFPKELAEAVVEETGVLTEIRLRACRPVQLVSGSADRFIGEPVSAPQMHRMLMAMMEHSYYAREEELAQGFFTMLNGCRVGVCGAYSIGDDGRISMRAIGSACIRIAREVRGCAEGVVEDLLSNGGPRSAILLSRPGMGKTTLLRDAARLLSDRGLSVGVADERHEIAACRDGVPTMDVGARTDVADGCPKHLAMDLLIRSMSPRVIVTDELGDVRDVEAVREAARRGAVVLTSVHGAGFDRLRGGAVGALISEGLFSTVFLLDGEPGKIAAVRHFGGDGAWS